MKERLKEIRKWWDEVIKDEEECDILYPNIHIYIISYMKI